MSEFKTKVIILLQGTSLTYFSPATSDVLVQQFNENKRVYLQTIDHHCVIVYPTQVPVVEVYAL